MEYLFKAIDGTIFENEDECKDYEKVWNLTNILKI
jgi:hypothetical protein